MKINSLYISQVIQLLKKLAVLLLLYTVARLLFFAFNYSYFQEATTLQLFKIFFFGIRFDYSAIVTYNLLFIVLYLLPFSFTRHRYFRKTLFVLFWFVNSLLLLTSFADIEYFKYTSKRTTADIFQYAAISDDVSKLLPQFLHDFWYIPLLWIVCVAAGIWLTRTRVTAAYPFKVFYLVLVVLITGLLFITARGFGMKPVRIITAARYASSQDIPLLLNTPFTIMHTLQEKNNAPRVYFPDTENQKIYSPLHQYNSSIKRNDNVVILIMESFSQEFIGFLSGKKTYTPFLDSLLNESLTFQNGFANCRKSIEAIPAILAGLPSLTNNSYISSHYAGNRLEAMPFILGKHGYSTAFFHGGRNGTMGFDEFSKVAGIKHYFGMKEYLGPEAFDGHWGIYDDEFLKYSAAEMAKFPQPFFSAIFTLSSHHPYTIPVQFEDIIPKNEEPQLRAIRYADMALKHFFDFASRLPWYRNTLFVIVADHTAKVIDPAYNNPVGTFRIPIVFYKPGDNTLKGRREDIAQQTDIMPSILNYLGINDPFLAYGNSVFQNRKPFAVNFLSDIYYFFQDDHILSFDGEKSLSLFQFRKDAALQTNLIPQQNPIKQPMENNLKAIIQDYNNRLDNNTLINKH